MYFLFESSAYDDDENNDDHDDGTQSSSCSIQHMPIFKKLNLFSFTDGTMVAE